MGTFEWKSSDPKSQGFSESGLEAFRDGLIARGSKALLVARRDHIVLEWYASENVRTQGHYTASMAKAMVGGVCLAVAMTDGRIDLDDAAAKYIPQWRNEPEKSQITVRQLGAHASGLDDAQPKDQGGWQQDFWARNDPPGDPFTISRDVTPLVAKPGTRYNYSNPGIAMLGWAITAAIQGGPHKDMRTLLRERVLRPIGLGDAEWAVGYGQTFEIDGLPLVPAWGGGRFTARAAARLGRLMLRGGDWEGTRLIDEKAVRETVADSGFAGKASGMGWRSNARGTYPFMPRDAFWAAGAEQQTLLVVPSLELVVVRNGASLGDPKDDDEPGGLRGTYLFEPLMAAMR